MDRLQKSIFGRHPLLVIPLIVALAILFPLADDIWCYLFDRWERLPQPPSNPVQLLGTGNEVGEGVDVVLGVDGQGYVQGDLFILGVDGQVYSYERYNHAWREDDADHVFIKVSCDSAGPFWARKHGECVSRSQLGVTQYFLLDQEGVFWYWADAPKLPSYLTWILSGLVLGILLAIALVRSQRRTEFSQG